MYFLGTVLSIQKLFYKHVGVYIGRGFVLHNHSQRGEEIVTVTQFADGNAISVEEVGVADQVAFLQRVRNVCATPQQYDFLSHNCDHTVSKVRTGVASSSQLAEWGFVAVLVVGSALLVKAAR